MKPFTRIVFFLFCIISLIEISLVALGQQELRIYSKPLIIPLLGLVYLQSTPRRKSFFQDAVLIALLFSWVGDILLQLEGLFVPGLLAFLTAHIFYIVFFMRTVSQSDSFFKLRPVMIIAVIAYLIELMYLLWPTLGEMKAPVLVYGITISTMLSVAFWQYQKLENKTALYFIIGASLFVLSDSLLALDKFRSSFSFAGISIMSTYILAQLFIVLGAIRYHNRATHLSE